MIKVNEVTITPTVFPDRTQQVWKLPEGIASVEDYTVEWCYEGDNEIMTIMQIVSLLGFPKKFILPYLPYGRQDKQVSNNATFGLHTFCRFLGHFVFPQEIVVFDPHSNEFEEIMKMVHRDIKITVVMPDLSEITKDYDVVCFPDAGAAARYTTTKPVIIGSKVRDQQSGKITDYTLSDMDIKGKAVLVVDDICDGGMTFVILGKILLKNEAIPSLYVSHGIFSKGVSMLYNYYRVVTTDSYLPKRRYTRTLVIDWKSFIK